MRLLWNKFSEKRCNPCGKKLLTWILMVLMGFAILVSFPGLSRSAEIINYDDNVTIDRMVLVSEQINILKNRLSQGEHELVELQQKHDQEISQLTMEKASKNLLDKASLDISVAKSNLDSINIELTDCQQTIAWLEKSVQEIENQLNVLSIFGIKIAKNQINNMRELRLDLNYQKKLLDLEKNRGKYLQSMQNVANNILNLKNENYNRIDTLLKSRKMLHVKQQQVKDELVYQEQQNQWLKELNLLYARLGKIDPRTAKSDYAEVERNIFLANENANYAYVQSLIARYKDQIQQMKLIVLRSNSISLLNEISDQVQLLNKQLTRLDGVLESRTNVLEKHINYLSQKKNHDERFTTYIKNLKELDSLYKKSDTNLDNLTETLTGFRKTLDQALQTELSARQGLPSFGIKMVLDVGKEMLLVPALTFQITKSLSNHLFEGIKAATVWSWSVFVLVQLTGIFLYFFLRKLIVNVLAKPSQWRDKINSKWLSLQWIKKNFLDLMVILNMLWLMFFFDVPLQNFIILIYLSFVWLIVKSIMILARLCLVETTHDSRGDDVKLYRHLRWIILMGGIITALTVFVHQLPLIYEIKILCDRLFLLLLMVVSLLLLRSYEVVPNLILSHMDARHPYLKKSICFIGILIPLLMFGNSVIGLLGYVNLIMTVSWYEGLFLIVLIGYLILRGFLSDGMEQLSRLMIQYVNNGWLWTEAVLKPLDKVLRIFLFLFSWTVLFLLYGWDKQSPIVERLMGLLHYQLANILNTVITPLSIIELFIVISIFYWTAKWTREFIYRLLLSRTKDMGIRNSIAILSQYSVVIVGVFICLRVLGIDLKALVVVFSMFALGIGWGLRDLVSNFASGFLILLERPLRVGDIVNINNIEGEVIHIGGRAVTVRTWDHMELVVPNSEIFNKSFTNWTARDNIVRTVFHIKISRYDNPHEVKVIIQRVLADHKDVLKDPPPEVYLKEMNDTLLDFELRYYVNIRQVSSRTSVLSTVLMKIWDEFVAHGIKPPYPQHEVYLKDDRPILGLLGKIEPNS